MSGGGQRSWILGVSRDGGYGGHSGQKLMGGCKTRMEETRREDRDHQPVFDGKVHRPRYSASSQSIHYDIEGQITNSCNDFLGRSGNPPRTVAK